MSDLKFDQILDEYVRFCNDSGKIDLNLYVRVQRKAGTSRLQRTRRTDRTYRSVRRYGI